MKVALIDNTNNNFFNVTRYLRDNGIDAHLLLNDNIDAHFHPSADSYDLSYKEFTIQLNWGSYWSFPKTTKKQIINDLKNFDIIISCGYIPAFLEKAGIKNTVFIPYGMDLYQYPFHNAKLNPGSIYAAIRYFRVNTFQKRGVQNASHLILAPTNPEFESIVEKIQFRGKRVYSGIPFLYTPIYNPSRISDFYNKSYWYHEFKKIRDSHDLVIFHPSRMAWKNPPNTWTYKGNDRLIHAFSDFLKSRKDKSAALILCEYGPDVYVTKKLIRELNIENNVKWFPLMNRKDIMIGVNHSDIIAGEFGRSWFSYGIIYEALAMGKPVMHFRDDNLYKDYYPTLYPMIHASSQNEIYEALCNYINNQKKFSDLGEEGRIWLQKYFIDDTVNLYVELINTFKGAERIS